MWRRKRGCTEGYRFAGRGEVQELGSENTDSKRRGSLGKTMKEGGDQWSRFVAEDLSGFRELI